jgi:branched-chain amino acid transport system permease protein
MVELLIGTLSQTAVLAPLIISLSLVFRVSRVVNFGAGHFVIVAGAAASAWGGWSVLWTIPLGAALGAAAYLIAVVPPRSRNVPAVGLTMSTLGFGLLLGWGTRALFGGNPSTLQPWIGGVVDLAGAQVSIQRLLIIGISALLLGSLYLLVDRTLIGRTLVAVAYDEDLAAMYGVRGSSFQLLAWGVGGMCMAVAGILQASIASVSADVAPTLLTFALIGAVVGGLGSLGGSVGGAFVIALAITATATFIPGVYVLTAAFVVLFVVLAVRPRGLFSTSIVAERV